MRARLGWGGRGLRMKKKRTCLRNANYWFHKSNRWVKKFLISIITISSLIFVFSITVGCLYLPNYLLSRAEAGQFGDMFGGANALFSGLAFAGVIIAILLQRKELIVQRRDLRLTRRVVTMEVEQLKGQKDLLQKQEEQMEGQKAALEKQNFETTFFNLLESFYKTTMGIDDYYQKLITTEAQIIPLDKRDIDRLNYAVDTLFENYPDVITFLYSVRTILAYIENNRFEQERLYYNIFNSYLRGDERTLLAACLFHKKVDADLLEALRRSNIFEELPPVFRNFQDYQAVWTNHFYESNG